MVGHALRTAILTVVSASYICSVACAESHSEWEARRQEQRKSYAALMDNVPLLKKTHPRDVMQLQVEDKVLVLRTPLPTTYGDGYARTKLDNMGEYALVRVQGGADPTQPKPIIPVNFQFTLNDYAKPQQITTLSVTAEQTYLTLSKSVQFPEGYSNVQLIERTGSPGYGMPGAVQLVVSENGNGPETPMNLSIEAPDFFTLVRSYPSETQEFLRPLLRELGQEQALAPDALVAWQVFSDQWKPDPAVKGAVRELLPKLNADDYRVREDATHALQKLGRAGAAVMVHLDRRTLSPEQNTRVDRALAAYAQLPPKEATRLRSDVNFLLDCLYCNETPLRKAAFARLRELTGPNLQFDLNADLDARSTEVAALREELTPTQPAPPWTALSLTR